MGMFVMYCNAVLCVPCQLWMCCLEKLYNVFNCDRFSVVNAYLDHLKLCVVVY